MVKEFSRQLRVAREMQKEIAIILRSAIRDPRINTLTTISGVKISRDLSHAKVYFTTLKNKDENNSKNSIKILQDASSYIRVLLGKTMRLRIVPKLIFFYDSSLEQGMRISRLISRRAEYSKKHAMNIHDNKEI